MNKGEYQLRVSMIVAVDNNYLMGSDNGGLPWKGIEKDKNHFRKYVASKTLLVGRKTFEEMDGWFQEHHTPYVLTRRIGYQTNSHTHVFNEIQDAIDYAKEKTVEEIVVCGGSEIYRLALQYTTTIILTILDSCFRVGGEPKFFPSIEELKSFGFEKYKEVYFKPSVQNEVGMSIIWLNRDRHLVPGLRK